MGNSRHCSAAARTVQLILRIASLLGLLGPGRGASQVAANCLLHTVAVLPGFLLHSSEQDLAHAELLEGLFLLPASQAVVALQVVGEQEPHQDLDAALECLGALAKQLQFESLSDRDVRQQSLGLFDVSQCPQGQIRQQGGQSHGARWRKGSSPLLSSFQLQNVQPHGVHVLLQAPHMLPDLHQEGHHLPLQRTSKQAGENVASQPIHDEECAKKGQLLLQCPRCGEPISGGC
uniref:Putative secreted protein n=1 Tax=Ixodes ricinus TaxID=34613 RepID=A0A6B0V4X5_IXORI